MNIIEPKQMFHFNTGVFKGEGVEHYQKKYQDISSIYASKDDQLNDVTMYEVYSFGGGEPNELLMGLTVMYPITVQGECNMTRGHFHLNRDEPEIYFGCAGEGLLLMMKEDGEVFAQKVFEGSVHYIHGCYAHRLINTGNTVFKVGAFWRALAGHDYDAITKHPFPYRVYLKEGKLVIE